MNTPEATKQCPYCAETIKAQAIVCRYCGRDLVDNVNQVVRQGHPQQRLTAAPASHSPFHRMILFITLGLGMLLMLLMLLMLIVFDVFLNRTAPAQPLEVAARRETIETPAAVEPTAVPPTVTPLVAPTDIPTPTPRPTDTPTAAPTALPTEVPPPTPMVLAVATSVIGTATANRETEVYSGPGTNFDTIGSVDAGQTLTIVGVSFDGNWYQLTDGAWIGRYMVGSLLSPDLALTATLAVVQMAELPTAQATAVSIPAFTPIPSHTPAPANALTPVSQVPEIRRAIVTVVAPETDVEELRAKATSYDVKELTRNTETYIGHVVTYYGRVLQVLEDKALFSDRVTYTLRFAVNDDYDTLITANLVYEDGQGFRPLEDDRLTIWGIVEGRKAYRTVLGAEVILPAVGIRYLETESEQGSTGEVVGSGEGVAPSSPAVAPSGPTIVVLSHRAVQGSSYWYIIGEVQNQSGYPVDFVKVVAILRDSNGNAVDTDYSYTLLDTIPANGKSPFSIGFGSWQGVSSYDLAVEGDRGDLPRQDLLVLSHGSSVEGTSLRIFGEVQNTGTTPAESVKLIVTLYDTNGQVVGADYTYTTLDTIQPGSTSAFSTSISRWEGFSYYAIQVEGR